MNTNAAELVDSQEEIVVELPRIAVLLRKAWQSVQTYMSRLWLAIFILLILQLPVLLLPPSPELTAAESTMLAAVFVVNIISGVFSVAVVHYVVQLFVDESLASLRASVRWVVKHIGTIIMLMALIFGIFVTGTLLLVVPMLVFAIYNMFTYIVLMREEKRSAMGYIVRSTELVYGAFWALAWRVGGILGIVWVGLGLAGWFFNQLVTMLLPFLSTVAYDVLFLTVATIIQGAGIIVTVSVLLQLYDVRYSQYVSNPTALPTTRLKSVYWTAASIGWLGVLSVGLGLFIILASSLLTV